jgi:hypothetical protein
MDSGSGLMIGTLPLTALLPLVLLGYMLLRLPVNLMISVEQPVLRRFVTLSAALVACRLLLSLPG